LVRDHERAAFVRGGQLDDERRDHIVVPLGVLVGREELPGSVHEHLVEDDLEGAALR
jgi:hypothetical protein